MDAINMVNTSGEPFSENLLADDQGGAGEHNVSIMVLRLFVCTVGVIGNAMVIFVILILKEYKKTLTNWYVLQLAFADLLFLFTLPFKVAEDAYGEWTFTGGMCKAKEAILFLNYYSSILFLMVMSIDRYVAVCHSFSARLRPFRKRRSAYFITAIVWVVSLLLCAPIIAFSDKSGVDPHCKCQYEFPMHEEECKNKGFLDNQSLSGCIAASQNEEKCKKIDYAVLEYLLGAEDQQPASSGSAISEKFEGPVYEVGCSYARNGVGWTAYLFFNFIVMFVLPFLIMSVCYCLIAFRLKQSSFRRGSVANESTATRPSVKTERKRSNSAASIKAERDRIRVTVTCLILVFLFLICWLPYHSVHLAKIKGIQGSSDFCAKLSAVSAVIAYLNSALNPYIYNFIGTNFCRRVRSAAGSVRTSVRKRTFILSSVGGTVRYQQRKHSAAGTSTNSATAVTKINRSKSETGGSLPLSHSEDKTPARETML